jgi:hypothetical protein
MKAGSGAAPMKKMAGRWSGWELCTSLFPRGLLPYNRDTAPLSGIRMTISFAMSISASIERLPSHSPGSYGHLTVVIAACSRPGEGSCDSCFPNEPQRN